MNLSWLGQYRDLGILLLRAGIGVMMVLHGWPKLAGGQQKWEEVGAAMSHVGISFWPVLWGFLAAMSETLGGALLAAGFLTRYAALFITFTMAVATAMMYHVGHASFNEWSHPAEIGIVCLSLVIIGAGKYSIDRA
ncbi:MAG: DoxX family protein [Verrucomicrobiota bacterium]